MWESLAGEYGQISELSCAQAEIAFHSLVKSDSMTMQERIDLFQKLRTDVDCHAPHGVPRLSKSQINFVRSLGSAYDVFQETLGNEITNIPTNSLYAKSKAGQNAVSLTISKQRQRQRQRQSLSTIYWLSLFHQQCPCILVYAQANHSCSLFNGV
jgi:hypothetical protein